MDGILFFPKNDKGPESGAELWLVLVYRGSHRGRGGKWQSAPWAAGTTCTYWISNGSLGILLSDGVVGRFEKEAEERRTLQGRVR